MANTVHGPYAKTTWTDGVTMGNQVRMGNLETQTGVALASFNPDLLTAAFILSGIACVKDGTTASKLNVTSGEAYLVMTDGTPARIDVAATSFTTVTISTTYFLDLNPDGTWNFATTHSAQANYLPICSVTTDGSGNISGVTDKRVMLAQVLTGAAHPSAGQPGGVALPTPLQVNNTAALAYTAQVTGGVTFGQVGSLAGSMDGAALFNGTTGYLTMPTSGLPTGNAVWSISARFKTSASGASQVILFAGSAALKSAMFLYVDSTGHVVIDLYSSNITSSAGGYNNGAWHSVLATWDGTNLTLYVDGAQVATSAALGPDNISYTYGYIGVYNNGSALASYFNGTLDEVAIYGAALTSGNATTLSTAATSASSDTYAQTVLGFSPLRYYRLGDAAGATSAYSATNTTVTLVNPDATLMIFGIGGQAAAGSLGVPVIVAQAIRQHVTTVGSNVTVLTFTPSVTGLYRVNGYVMMQDSAARALGFIAQWTDPDSNFAGSQWLLGVGGTGGTTIQAFNNSNLWNNGIGFGASSAPFMAKAGAGINVVYQHDTGAANDYVTAVIERLA